MKHIVLLILLCLMYGCKESETKPVLKINKIVQQCDIKDLPKQKETKIIDTRPSENTIIKEVVMLWNMWYDDQGIKPHHKLNKRREKFKEYGTYLATAVRYFQINKTDMGGILPIDNTSHIIAAVVAAAETAVRPEMIGKLRNEVGIFQVHGAALNGHKRREVINNPQLGIFLGIRWLTYHTQFCNQKATGMDFWKQPLTLYAAGLRAGRYKNKKCKEISVAKRRVRLAKMYRERIDALNSSKL